MYCTKCGTQLPVGAAFCWKCGSPTATAAQNTQGQTAPFDWETCEIVFDDKNGFWANAIGPNGQYNAGQVSYSMGLTGLNMNEKAMQMHRTLINRLVQEGWQPDGKGQ